MEREINAYWTREATAAYREREALVRSRYRENGGVVEPYMRFQITERDLRAIVASGPF
jgi:hypothetical protein